MIGKLIERLRFAREHRWAQRHISEYLDGDLDQAGRERASRHIGECVECDELLASLRAMVTTLAGIGGEPAREVAASVFAGVHQRLAERTGDDGSL